jgi:hypothetical protein
MKTNSASVVETVGCEESANAPAMGDSWSGPLLPPIAPDCVWLERSPPTALALLVSTTAAGRAGMLD